MDSLTVATTEVLVGRGLPAPLLPPRQGRRRVEVKNWIEKLVLPTMAERR